MAKTTIISISIQDFSGCVSTVRQENGISGNKYWKVETKIITYKESVFPGKNQEDQVKNLNIGEFSEVISLKMNANINRFQNNQEN